jgi:hypothetical protein
VLAPIARAPLLSKWSIGNNTLVLEELSFELGDNGSARFLNIEDSIGYAAKRILGQVGSLGYSSATAWGYLWYRRGFWLLTMTK